MMFNRKGLFKRRKIVASLKNKETAETWLKFRLSLKSEGKLGKVGEVVETNCCCFNGKPVNNFRRIISTFS